MTLLKEITERAENVTFSIFIGYLLVKEYADKQGVTEQLKAENQLLWVKKMNNIRACVKEVVENE